MVSAPIIIRSISSWQLLVGMTFSPFLISMAFSLAMKLCWLLNLRPTSFRLSNPSAYLVRGSTPTRSNQCYNNNRSNNNNRFNNNNRSNNNSSILSNPPRPTSQLSTTKPNFPPSRAPFTPNTAHKNNKYKDLSFICQICSKVGHSAKICYWRFEQDNNSSFHVFSAQPTPTLSSTPTPSVD